MDHNLRIRNLLAPFLPLELVLNILYEFKAIQTPSCKAIKNLLNKNNNCIFIVPKRNMHISDYNTNDTDNTNNTGSVKNKYIYFGMNYENDILKLAQIMKQ